MAPETDYRDEYLEERFNRVFDRLDLIIKTQQAQDKVIGEISSRMTIVERTQLTCGIEQLKKGTEERFKEFDDIVEEVRFYKRHPNQLKALVITGTLVILFNLILFIKDLKGLFN